jgi:hypothetical protein
LLYLATMSAWLTAVDRPARQSLDLAREPASKTMVIAAAGSALVAVASLLSEALANSQANLQLPEGRLVQAFFESLILVLPSSAILFAFANLRLPARALFSAAAVGLLVAGLVTISTLPLMGYLVLVSRAAPLFKPMLILPVLALFGVGATVGRVIEAVEDPPVGVRAARFFYLFLGATFFVRALAHLGTLKG